MQVKNLPVVDARYWTAIVAASMCGANSGDFVSRNLHLGHVRGLLPLLIAFLVVLWLEHRSRRATEAYYWLGIIVLRTAATNLADLAAHDLKIDYALVEAGLAFLLVLILVVERLAGPRPKAVERRSDLPATDTAYWLAMLTAGTLGTASGDWVADELGLGVGLGSVVLLAIFGAVLLLSLRVGGMTKPWYWLSIVAARTVGTTLGDFLASRKGLGLGLPVSLTCTSLLLVGILVLWRGKDAATGSSASALSSPRP